MEIQVVNFKAYSSGALCGFFDMELHGLTFVSCKIFKKDDRLWFQLPSQKITSASGEVKYHDIVTASPAVMRELQDAVRPHLRTCLGIDPEETRPFGGPPSCSTAARGERGERAYQASRRAAQDPAGADIPF